jgi:hypothetical protein
MKAVFFFSQIRNAPLEGVSSYDDATIIILVIRMFNISGLSFCENVKYD